MSNGRGRFQPYRGGGGPGPMRGGGPGPMRGRGRGRGRGAGEHPDAFGRDGTKRDSAKPGRLVPVRPTAPSPAASTTWRVLYVVPPSSRPEVGPAGEKIPGPFSPPLRASSPDTRPLAGLRRPQDELRKENAAFLRKQRVQTLLQQAANSASGGMGTYVGKLSKHNNPLIPVLPRLDQRQGNPPKK